jgi:transposase InsO family protein
MKDGTDKYDPRVIVRIRPGETMTAANYIELMKLRGRAPRLVDPLRAMAIRDKPIAPGSPWQNSFAERLIAIRRECVDHIVVLGEAHLRQTLREYARYYNTARTHRSLDQDAPVSRHVWCGR